MQSTQNSTYVVGTLNKFKINSIKDAVATMAFGYMYDVLSIDANLDLPPQPMSDEEGMSGAFLRAAAAKGYGTYGVGIEGCIQQVGANYYVSEWVAVAKGPFFGYGSSQKVRIPTPIMNIILKENVELGVATAKYYGLDEKIIDGAQDIFTNGISKRKEGIMTAFLYAQADLENSIQEFTNL